MIPRLNQLCMVDPGWDYSPDWKDFSDRIAAEPSRFIEYVENEINGQRMLWESTAVKNASGVNIQFFTDLYSWSPIVPAEKFDLVADEIDRQLTLF
nr:hypothetical protein 14 [Spirochaetaceae bacterium]